MTMTIHSYPMCCTGFVLYGFFAKKKEEQLDQIYKLLEKQKPNTQCTRPSWRNDGHVSAVTMDGQLPGREALDEIGFIRNTGEGEGAYISKRYDTNGCHHSIAVSKLIEWFEEYGKEYEKRHAAQQKAQKDYTKWVAKSKKALKEMVSNV